MEIKPSDAQKRIECFCARKPLLALAGRDSRTGKSFVQVRVVKNGRPISEVIITSGVMHIRCRECLRFHKVTVLPSAKRMYDVELVLEGAGKISG